MVDPKRRSAREMATKCLFRFKAQYLDGIEMGNDDTRRGSLFHRARELYVKALWKAKENQSPELAIESFSKACIESPIPTEARQRAAELFTRWYERYELDAPTFYAVETALPCFDTTIRYDEVRVPSHDTLRIIDSKTFWRMPTTEAIRASFQARFYLAAARRLFPGFACYQFQHEYPAYGQVSEPVSLTDAELDGVEREIAEIDAAIAIAAARDEYPATGGSQCSTCTIAYRCPSAAQQSLRDGTSATLSVGFIAAMSRAIEQHKDALAAYCEVHGAVQANGQEWAHREASRTTYPAADVLETLTLAGIDYKLTVSSTAVKSLLTAKKYAGVADEIRSLGTTKVSTEFSCKTVTAADGPQPIDFEPPF